MEKKKSNKLLFPGGVDPKGTAKPVKKTKVGPLLSKRLKLDHPAKPLIPPETKLRDNIVKELERLRGLEEQVKRQLDGVANQIYALDNALHPKKEEKEMAPNDSPPGTV